VTGAGAADYRPALHPAGGDTRLRLAVEDVRLGRWLSMRTLLSETGSNWALRTSRSQVLASTAVRSRAVREWLQEEPGSADAVMMRARVATEMVLRAHRAGHPVTTEVAQARAAAYEAARVAPADPVPWVCLIAQAQTDPAQSVPDHRRPPPDVLLVPGPWGLLGEARARDPYNREAHHRVLQFVLASHYTAVGAEVIFAEWLGSVVPVQSHSPLLVLPLYAFVEHYRQRREGRKYDVQHQGHWSTESVRAHTARGLEWFAHCDTRLASPLDLNYVAHAAWADRRFREAAPVLEAIGPHMTTRPWTYVTPVPGDRDYAIAEFDKARRQCLAIAATPPPPKAAPPTAPAPASAPPRT
jgi:hypothetical protein